MAATEPRGHLSTAAFRCNLSAGSDIRCMAHLLFLSHAGVDTERAVKLAAAIEASPEAQAAGLKVWVDKRPDGPHRLHAGTAWQELSPLVVPVLCRPSAATLPPPRRHIQLAT